MARRFDDDPAMHQEQQMPGASGANPLRKSVPRYSSLQDLSDDGSDVAGRTSEPSPLSESIRTRESRSPGADHYFHSRGHGSEDGTTVPGSREDAAPGQQTLSYSGPAPSTPQGGLSQALGSPSHGTEWASHAAGAPLLGSDNTPPSNVPQEFSQTQGEETVSWKPLYLRKRVFYAFIALFGALILALEAIFAVSLHNQGLATSSSSLHYLWTYGPAAVMILVAMIWARLDYETKITAPWLRPREGLITKESLLLDYVSMFPPLVPFEAFRNRDFLVLASSTVSLIFNVLVVLSTGLITLSLTQMTNESMPIVLQNAFVDDPSRLSRSGLLPLYTMKGISDYSLSYPDGSSDQFAYQSFSSGRSLAPELHATVDGIFAGLDCQEATIKSVEIGTSNSDKPQPTLVVNTTLGDCVLSQSFQSALINDAGSRADDVGDTGTMHLARLAPGDCGSSTDLDRKRVVFWLAQLKFTLTDIDTRGGAGSRPYSTYYWDGTILQSTVMFCAPTYSLTSVDVIKHSDGRQKVSLKSDAPSRTLSNVHPWDIMQAHFHSYGVPVTSKDFLISQEVNISDTTIQVDEYSSSILANSTDSFQQSPSPFDYSILKELLSKYYTQFSAFLIQQGLMEPISEQSTATALVMEERLVVKAMACHFMAGLLLLSILIIALVINRIPGPAALPFEPGSIIGAAALSGMSVSTSFPQNLGGTSIANLRGYIHGNFGVPLEISREARSSDFPGGLAAATGPLKMVHPMSLRPPFRIAVYVLVAGFIATLESTLHTSNKNQGLGDIEDDTYLHYLWTTLPAIILSLTGMFFSSVDFQSRLLAPYYALSKGASFWSSLRLDLLRPLMPRVLHTEARTRNFAALATTLAALFSAAFTIVSGSLFLTTSIPAATSVKLRTTGTFAKNASEFNSVGWPPDPNLAASLVLEANLSYPAWTYEDLIIPKLTIDDTSDNFQPSNASAITFDAVVPAMRPHLSCHVYPSSAITTGFEYNQSFFQALPDVVFSDALIVNITGEQCAKNSIGATITSTATVWTNNTEPTEAYFGSASDDGSIVTHACSPFFYVWGHFSMLSDPPAVTVSAMRCNISLESVDVATTFSGTDLHIDPSTPPKPDESTVRAIPELHDSESFTPFSWSFYDGLAALPSADGAILDPFFGQLVSSHNATPLTSLGDTAQTQAVVDSIKFQHGIVRAQFHNAYSRMDLDAAGGSAYPPLSTESDDTGLYEAKVIDPYGRRRLMQDAVSTHILEGLLVSTLVLALIGWALARKTAVLPRSPSSVASVLALLAGGNILDYMYRKKEGGWSSLDDIHTAFSHGSRFWMGWGPPGAAEGLGRRFGIWVLTERPGEMSVTEGSEAGYGSRDGFVDIGKPKPGATEYQGAGAQHGGFEHTGMAMTEVTVTPWPQEHSR